MKLSEKVESAYTFMPDIPYAEAAQTDREHAWYILYMTILQEKRLIQRVLFHLKEESLLDLLHLVVQDMFGRDNDPMYRAREEDKQFSEVFFRVLEDFRENWVKEHPELVFDTLPNGTWFWMHPQYSHVKCEKRGYQYYGGGFPTRDWAVFDAMYRYKCSRTSTL